MVAREGEAPAEPIHSHLRLSRSFALPVSPFACRCPNITRGSAGASPFRKLQQLPTVFLILLNLAQHPVKLPTGEFAVAVFAFTRHVNP